MYALSRQSGDIKCSPRARSTLITSVRIYIYIYTQIHACLEHVEPGTVHIAYEKPPRGAFAPSCQENTTLAYLFNTSNIFNVSLLMKLERFSLMRLQYR